jgi:hypothetical protein
MQGRCGGGESWARERSDLEVAPQSRCDYTGGVREGETPLSTRETRVLPGRRTGDEREQERNVEHRTSNVERRERRAVTRGRRRARREAEE